MPTLDQHKSITSSKVILAGDSGIGKSGALISLVEANYNLRILDTDDGLDYLRSLVITKCPSKLKNINYHTVTQDFRILGGKLQFKGLPNVWTRSMKLFNEWDKEAGIGHLNTWTDKDVLVIDSLTFLARAALLQSKALNNRLYADTTDLRDYGNAGSYLEELFGFICSDQVKCNIICTTHISAHDIDKKNEKGKTIKEVIGLYPALVGRKVESKVGTYFNSTLGLKRRGIGAGTKRIIVTQPHGLLDLKSSSTTVPAELPIETGLADYFKLVRTPANPK